MAQKTQLRFSLSLVVIFDSSVLFFHSSVVIFPQCSCEFLCRFYSDRTSHKGQMCRSTKQASTVTSRCLCQCMEIEGSSCLDEDEVITKDLHQGYTNLEIVAFINDVRN